MRHKWVRIITPPSVEPVTVSECKLDARVDGNAEDALFASWITTARSEVEIVSARALINRTLEMAFDRWPPEQWITLRYPPLVNVISITYYDSDGAQQTLPTDQYIVETDSEPGRIWLAPGASWPTTHEIARIRVRYVAGYGTSPASVPDEYKAAIRGLVNLAYQYRAGFTLDGERKRANILAKLKQDWGW